MKEIHLGQILVENRRQRGITQEELARFLGVSKAAVSKWETEAAYPDIHLLPRLASFFDITIDQLMGYEPQLTREEIRQIYCRLAEAFTILPFSEVLEQCREYIRRYSSCYPFLFQIGVLLVNHINLAPSPEVKDALLKETTELFKKVKAQAGEPGLISGALQMEAYCLLLCRRSKEVLDLLSDNLSGTEITGPFEPLLASAWQMSGNAKEAKRVLQVGIYRALLALVNQMMSYISLCSGDPEAVKESCRRLQNLCDSFHLDELHPGLLLSCYITMAQGFLSAGEKEKAMETLDRYTRLAAGKIYPLRLHGDKYFYLLDEWFQQALFLGDYPPRNETAIRRSITQALADNPAFASLSEEPRFLEMIWKLKEKEEEN